VLGGCLEYSGAPYYAASAALASGADLGFVLCGQSAAVPIKCYSPELIVIPAFDDSGSDEIEEADGVVGTRRGPSGVISSFVPRLSCLVVGPGLGRSEAAVRCASAAIQTASDHGIPIVIDADGLWIVERDAGQGGDGTVRNALRKSTAPVVLTPNAAEFARLQRALGLTGNTSSEAARQP